MRKSAFQLAAVVTAFASDPRVCVCVCGASERINVYVRDRNAAQVVQKEGRTGGECERANE